MLINGPNFSHVFPYMANILHRYYFICDWPLIRNILAFLINDGIQTKINMPL